MVPKPSKIAKKFSKTDLETVKQKRGDRPKESVIAKKAGKLCKKWENFKKAGKMSKSLSSASFDAWFNKLVH